MSNQQLLSARYEFFVSLRNKLRQKAPPGFRVEDYSLDDNWFCASTFPGPPGPDRIGSLNYSFSNASRAYDRPASFRVEFYIDAWGAARK